MSPLPSVSKPKFNSIPYSGRGGLGARHATITNKSRTTNACIPAVDKAAIRLFFFSCSCSVITTLVSLLRQPLLQVKLLVPPHTPGVLTERLYRCVTPQIHQHHPDGSST